MNETAISELKADMNELKHNLQKVLGRESFFNLDEALKFAKIVAQTEFAPKEMRNKPYYVFLAIQMGAEIGLKALQAVQNIAVINGKPCVYGDAALAIAKVHKSFEYCKEYFIDNDNTAVCEVKRKNEPLVKYFFSLEDAQKAGLLTNNTSSFSPWRKYTKRMLQLRARGFALRDSFPDALKGLITREEAEDYVVIPEKLPSHIPVTISDTPEEFPSEEQLKVFYNYCEELNISEELKNKWLEKEMVDKFEDFSKDSMEKLIMWLANKKFSEEDIEM